MINYNYYCSASQHLLYKIDIFPISLHKNTLQQGRWHYLILYMIFKKGGILFSDICYYVIIAAKKNMITEGTSYEPRIKKTDPAGLIPDL